MASTSQQQFIGDGYLREKKDLKGEGDKASIELVVAFYNPAPNAKKGNWVLQEDLITVIVKGKRAEGIHERKNLGRYCLVKGVLKSRPVPDASGTIILAGYVEADKFNGIKFLLGSDPGLSNGGKDSKKSSSGKASSKSTPKPGGGKRKPSDKPESETPVGEAKAEGADTGSATAGETAAETADAPPAAEPPASPADESNGGQSLDEMPFV